MNRRCVNLVRLKRDIARSLEGNVDVERFNTRNLAEASEIKNYFSSQYKVILTESRSEGGGYEPSYLLEIRKKVILALELRGFFIT